jgi:hypothetical protein
VKFSSHPIDQGIGRGLPGIWQATDGHASNCGHPTLFLICSTRRLISPSSTTSERDMANECERCGDPTMSETTIKLRCSVLGFRETRSQGRYCPTCKLSVSMENHATVRPSALSDGRLRSGPSRLLPMWLRVAPVRSGGVEWV